MPGDNGLDWLIQVDSVSLVQKLTPTPSQLKDIPARGIIVTAGIGAPGDDSVDEKESVFRGEKTQFVSRVFFGRDGTGEDPVTGSAHCFLATHWAGIYKVSTHHITCLYACCLCNSYWMQPCRVIERVVISLSILV